MQWAVPLLLLFGAVAVASLNCHFMTRYSATLGGLQNVSWGPAQHNKTTHYKHRTWECDDPTWKVCANWIIKSSDVSWAEYYGGCYNSERATWDPRTQLVKKYCADPQKPNCSSTNFIKADLKHRPAFLCCCSDDLCYTSNASFQALVDEQALATTVKPPPRPTLTVTCEVSMRNATSSDDLRNATAEYEDKQTCQAEWAPCVEFVYQDVQGLWRQWRAGCSYKYGNATYQDVVDDFCTASYKCKAFDMVEPQSRATRRIPLFRYTDAYACCCSGTNCSMPDTISFVSGVPQTAPSPVTSVTAQPSSGPPTTAQPTGAPTSPQPPVTSVTAQPSSGPPTTAQPTGAPTSPQPPVTRTTGQPPIGSASTGQSPSGQNMTGQSAGTTQHGPAAGGTASASSQSQNMTGQSAGTTQHGPAAGGTASASSQSQNMTGQSAGTTQHGPAAGGTASASSQSAHTTTSLPTDDGIALWLLLAIIALVLLLIVLIAIVIVCCARRKTKATEQPKTTRDTPAAGMVDAVLTAKPQAAKKQPLPNKPKQAPPKSGRKTKGDAAPKAATAAKGGASLPDTQKSRPATATDKDAKAYDLLQAPESSLNKETMRDDVAPPIEVLPSARLPSTELSAATATESAQSGATESSAEPTTAKETAPSAGMFAFKLEFGMPAADKSQQTPSSEASSTRGDTALSLKSTR